MKVRNKKSSKPRNFVFFLQSDTPFFGVVFLRMHSPENQQIAPENQWLEDVFPIKIASSFWGYVDFLGDRPLNHVSFWHPVFKTGFWKVFLPTFGASGSSYSSMVQWDLVTRSNMLTSETSEPVVPGTTRRSVPCTAQRGPGGNPFANERNADLPRCGNPFDK